LKCNPLGKNPSDVWEIPKVTSGQNRSAEERTPHVAQFPLAVIDRIIKASSNEGDVIFDPFIGSGTTAVAALHNKRQVIGFEINPDYCQIAANRIEDYFRARHNAELQLGMFDSDSSMSLKLRVAELRWACCPVGDRCPNQSAWSSQPKRISLISGWLVCLNGSKLTTR
jgi:DNA methylase